MSADLPALLAQATDEAKSNTERLFAAVALRKQIDSLIGALDDGSPVGGITAAVVTDVLAKGEGQSGTYHVESGNLRADEQGRGRAPPRLHGEAQPVAAPKCLMIGSGGGQDKWQVRGYGNRPPARGVE